MNKAELVEVIAEKSNVSKRLAETVLDSTIEAITDALSSGHSIKLVGFGNFEVRSRAGRKGRNLQTNEIVEIPPARSPVFKAGKTLKNRVTQGNSPEPV